jgi:hypothetical protein
MDILLIGIQTVIPLGIAILVLALTYRYYRTALADLTGSDSIARLFPRCFAATVLLATLAYPLGNEPCSLEQLLSHVGIALLITSIALFLNLLVIYKIVSVFGRRAARQSNSR